jgi:hypothetical protein
VIRGIVLAGVTAPGSAVRNFPFGIRIVAIRFGDDGMVGIGDKDDAREKGGARHECVGLLIWRKK